MSDKDPPTIGFYNSLKEQPSEKSLQSNESIIEMETKGGKINKITPAPKHKASPIKSSPPVLEESKGNLHDESESLIPHKMDIQKSQIEQKKKNSLPPIKTNKISAAPAQLEEKMEVKADRLAAEHQSQGSTVISKSSSQQNAAEESKINANQIKEIFKKNNINYKASESDSSDDEYMDEVIIKNVRRASTFDPSQLAKLHKEDDPSDEVLNQLKRMANYFKDMKQRPDIETKLLKQSKLERAYSKFLSKTGLKNEKLDLKSVFTKIQEDIENETPVVTAAQNQAKYLRNYGVNFEIPSVVIIDSKFYPKCPEYMLQIVHYNSPGSDEAKELRKELKKIKQKKLKKVESMQLPSMKRAKTANFDDEESVSESSDCCEETCSSDEEGVTKLDTKVITYNIDGKVMKPESYKHVFKRFQAGVHLQLLKKDSSGKKGMKRVGESIILGIEDPDIIVKDVLIQFTPNSEYLIIFMKDLNKLNIYKMSGDIEQDFRDMQDGKDDIIHWVIQNKENAQNEMDKPYVQTNELESLRQYDAAVNEIGCLQFQYETLKSGKFRFISFSNDSRYMVLYGNKRMTIIDIEEKQILENWKLPCRNLNIVCEEFTKLIKNDHYDWLKKYSLILNVGIKMNDGKLQCLVACKHNNKKQVDIIEHDKKETNKRFIYYTDNCQKHNIIIQMSKNLDKFMFANQDENYIMKVTETSDGNSKLTFNRLPQIKDRSVIKVYPDQFNSFFIIVSKMYDQKLTVLHSESERFQIAFDKNIEPDSMQIMDVDAQFQLGKNVDEGYLCSLRVISKRDNMFSLDQGNFEFRNINPDSSLFNNRFNGINNIKIQADQQATVSSFCTKWPFTAFSGLKNDFIMILNAYDLDLIYRIQLPGNPDKIVQSYITETNNLFVVTQKDEWYYYQYIDLNNGKKKHHHNEKSIYQKYILTTLFKYSINSIDGQKPLTTIHVRGSSEQEQIDNNERLIISMIHGGDLYYWNQSFQQKVKSQEKHDQILKVKMDIFKKMKDQLDGKLQKQQSQQISERDIKYDEKLYEFEESVPVRFVQSIRQIDIDQKCEPMDKEKIEYVETTSLVFYRMDRDQKYFLLENNKRAKDKQITGQSIYMYKLGFNQITRLQVYNEYISNKHILNFNIDHISEKILIFNLNKQISTQKIYSVSIFCLRKKRVIFETNIFNTHLIGRLESGLYTFAEGHIYFNNHVIKIRYDLINSPYCNNYKENEIFDYYFDILNLAEGQKVMLGCPFDSMIMNRQVYIIQSINNFKTHRVLILPYLHERRIYLQRYKENTDYFCTSIPYDPKFKSAADHKSYQDFFTRGDHEEQADEIQKSLIVSVNLSEYKYYIFSERGLLRNSVCFKKEINENGSPIAVSPNGRNFLFLKTERNKDGFRQHILSCFTLTEKKLEFIKDFNTYDGIKDLFERLKNSKNQQARQKRKEIGEKIETLLDINDWALKIDHTKFTFLINDHLDFIIKMELKKKFQPDGRCKNIEDPYKLLDEYIYKKKNDSFGEKEEQDTFMSSINKSMKSLSPKKIPKKDKVLLLKDQAVENIINEKKDKESYLHKLSYDTIYYYQSGQVGVPQTQPFWISPQNHCTIYDVLKFNTRTPRVEQHYFYFESEYTKPMLIDTTQKINEVDFDAASTDFKMNSNFVILWNKSTIWYIKFCKDQGKYVQQKLDYNIEDDTMKIIDVRVGSNTKIIAIILELDSHQDCVVTWNLEKLEEKEIFDVPRGYEILWDHHGYPYIVSKEGVIITKQRVFVKCFELKEFIKFQNDDIYDGLQRAIGLQQGHKIDCNGHNWMIMNEYISLPFSYMTFVIKHKIEIEDELQQGNMFDVEPYNYIHNRSTAFIDSQFVRDDFIKLQEVLENLSKLDVNYLNYLHYTRNKKNGYIKNVSTQKTLIEKLKEKWHGESLSDIKAYKRISPLHISSVEQYNQKITSILLKYMSFKKTKSSHMYKDIFPAIVDIKGFINYLDVMRLQSYDMNDKQILKLQSVNKKYNQQIAAISDSKRITLDEKYYVDKMKESLQDGSKAFAVDVRAFRIDWIINDDNEIDFGYKFLEALEDNDENLEIFGNKTVTMIIEYFYSKFKYLILRLYLAFNLFQIFIFIVAITANEQRYQSELSANDLDDLKCGWASVTEDSPCHEDFVYTLVESTHSKSLIVVFRIAAFYNFLLTLCELFFLCFEYYGNQKQSLKKYLQSNLQIIVFIGLNMLQTYFWVINDGEQTKYERRYSAFICLIIFYKILYYLKQFSYFTTYIDSFMEILREIKFFAILVFYAIIAFTASFYLLGKNQLQYGELTNAEAENVIEYAYFTKGIWTVYAMMLGYMESQAEFFVGNQEEQMWLQIVYYIASFLLIIHLLNMLIAIMGNQLSNNTQNQRLIRQQEKLRFVLDKWAWKDYIIFSKKKNNWMGIPCVDEIKFIICAFISEDEVGDQSLMKQILEEQQKQDVKIRQFQDIMINEMKKNKLQQEKYEKEQGEMKAMLSEVLKK